MNTPIAANTNYMMKRLKNGFVALFKFCCGRYNNPKHIIQVDMDINLNQSSSECFYSITFVLYFINGMERILKI